MTTPGADAFPRAGLDAPFAVPEKKIGSEADVVRFQRSVAFARFMAFIELLNAAVKGKTCLDQDIPSSPTISRLIELLDVLNGLIDEVPPSTGPRRFGNVAFRTWMGKLDEVPTFVVWKAAYSQRAPTLLREYLPAECHPALVEMTPYFLGGFGSGQRLDYGTGHELSFAAFLCSLFLLRILDPAKDAVATALLIFPKYFNRNIEANFRYFSLIRRLVEMYTLEPAGSHGVWGLDDTSFLPFLLGSGQLREEAGAPPTESIMRPEVVEAQKDKNLYFAAIAWINKVPPLL